MHRESFIFPQFLRTDFDNAEQIEQLVSHIPSANEPFAADALYEHLYNALSEEERQKYSSTCTPQNLQKIIIEQKAILKKIVAEINKIIKRYNEANNNAFELSTLNALIEREIKSVDIKISTKKERIKLLSLFNFEAKNLRQYLFINLVFVLDPDEEFYVCTYCNKWVYKPSPKQIATFKKNGTILHEECRKARKSQKSSERRKK